MIILSDGRLIITATDVAGGDFGPAASRRSHTQKSHNHKIRIDLMSNSSSWIGRPIIKVMITEHRQSHGLWIINSSTLRRNRS